MADESGVPTNKRSALRDVSGTTLALTSLAMMGVAAVVSAPVWFWYRRKRKRTDALVSQVPFEATTGAAASAPAAGDEPAGSGDAAPPADDGRSS